MPCFNPSSTQAIKTANAITPRTRSTAATRAPRSLLRKARSSTKAATRTRTMKNTITVQPSPGGQFRKFLRNLPQQFPVFPKQSVVLVVLRLLPIQFGVLLAVLARSEATEAICSTTSSALTSSLGGSKVTTKAIATQTRMSAVIVQSNSRLPRESPWSGWMMSNRRRLTDMSCPFLEFLNAAKHPAESSRPPGPSLHVPRQLCFSTFLRMSVQRPQWRQSFASGQDPTVVAKSAGNALLSIWYGAKSSEWMGSIRSVRFPS